MTFGTSSDNEIPTLGVFSLQSMKDLYRFGTQLLYRLKPYVKDTHLVFGCQVLVRKGSEYR